MDRTRPFPTFNFTVPESLIETLREITPTVSPFEYVETSISTVAKTIAETAYSKRHILFFSLSTVLASISFPKVFLTGLTIGYLSVIVTETVSNTLKNSTEPQESFTGSSYIPEAVVAQTTLGVASLVGRLFFASNSTFFLGQDGVTSSLLSGVLAGGYAASLTSFVCIKLSSFIR